jgi:hypothetical protein
MPHSDLQSTTRRLARSAVIDTRLRPASSTALIRFRATTVMLFLVLLSVLGVSRTPEVLLAAGPGTVTGDAATDTDDITCGGQLAVSLQLTGQAVTSATPTDLVLVLDESGSVNPTQFGLLKSFAVDVVEALDGAGLFSNGGKMGVVMFNDTARQLVDLSDDAESVTLALQGMSQIVGNTCIGCGINMATDMFEAESNSARVMIVLTDGANNRPFTFRRDRLHISPTRSLPPKRRASCASPLASART